MDMKRTRCISTWIMLAALSALAIGRHDRAYAGAPPSEVDLGGRIYHKRIPTRRNFAIMVIFPAWDPVVRVDVGNMKWFGAEASKDYPNFVVLFQKADAGAAAGPLQSNATVLLKSGHVYNLEMISVDKAKGGAPDIAKIYDFSNEYEDTTAVKTVALAPPAPPGPTESEKAVLARLQALEATFERAVAARAKDKIFDEMARGDHAGRPLAKGGDGHLDIQIDEIRPVNTVSLVAFTVINRTGAAVELLEPHVTLETIKGKKTLRSKTLPVEKVQVATRIEPNARVHGVLSFSSDFERDANQVIRFAVTRKAAADKPIKVTLF